MTSGRSHAGGLRARRRNCGASELAVDVGCGQGRTRGCWLESEGWATRRGCRRTRDGAVRRWWNWIWSAALVVVRADLEALSRGGRRGGSGGELERSWAETGLLEVADLGVAGGVVSSVSWRTRGELERRRGARGWPETATTRSWLGRDGSGGRGSRRLLGSEEARRGLVGGDSSSRRRRTELEAALISGRGGHEGLDLVRDEGEGGEVSGLARGRRWGNSAWLQSLVGSRVSGEGEHGGGWAEVEASVLVGGTAVMRSCGRGGVLRRGLVDEREAEEIGRAVMDEEL